MVKDELNKVEKLGIRPFTRFCMSIGAVPSSYIAGLTIEEQLLWLCSYLEKEVIPTVNNNGQAVEELQELFVELKNYVDNYFDNLDVQEEINNKLDDMVEQGTLQEIIAGYLNSKAVFAFDNVEEMKSSTNLINGSYAKTLGFYSKNDCGESTYKIRTITNDDVIDGFSIIEMGDSENNLIAELIISKSMNLTQFGVHQDNETDDSDLLQNAINFASDKNIELVGTYNPIIITKSIYIPYNVKIKNTYFKTTSSNVNFNNNYMIGINTTNMSTWVVEYPYSNVGYMNHCKIENGDSTHNINGIYNCANNTFEDLLFNQLNISFRTGFNYLDTVIMKNFMITNKIGSEYALYLGYLGDQCSLDTAHMAGTIGERNFCYIGDAHNPITLKNIIPNGKIYSENSLINIDGIHNENTTHTQFEFKNCQVSMENGYLYHVNNDESNINLTNYTSLILKNVLFCYEMKENSYENSTDIDINLTANCTVTVINSYKTVINVGSADHKYKSGIKTNLDSQPTLKNVLTFNNATSSQEPNQGNYVFVSTDVGFVGTSGESKWYLPSGTYYYKFVSLIDKQRMIGSYWTKKINQALVNNDSGFKSSFSNPNVYRVYRGTSDNTYDQYVDIANVDPQLIDNGYMLNGYKWNDRTAGDSDTFLVGVLSLTRPTKENVVLTGDFSATPTFGTWKRGDIIFSTHAGITGYICTADGTPGTWKQL